MKVFQGLTLLHIVFFKIYFVGEFIFMLIDTNATCTEAD